MGTAQPPATPAPQWRVHFQPRVIVRAQPSLGSRIVGSHPSGHVVTAARSSPHQDLTPGWIQLSASSLPKGATEGWMLVDGASLDLHALLVPVLPRPRVVFVGSYSVVLAWDPVVFRTTDAALDGGALPLALEVRRQEGAAPERYDTRDTDSMHAYRVGGLTPGSELSVRITATWGSGSTSVQLASEGITCRTLPARPFHLQSEVRHVPDPFGKLRGRVQGCSALRRDCPTGWWMPAELMTGGLNAAVADFRCGDCCMPPSAHAVVPIASTDGIAPKAASVRHSSREHVKADARSTSRCQCQSRLDYIAMFKSWDSQREHWRELWRDPSGASETVIATSDLHIDFPANMAWLEQFGQHSRLCKSISGSQSAAKQALKPTKTSLVLAGDICTSLTKLKTAFLLLVSRFHRVFYCPGNHELWTSKNECNSVDKFFRILALADECGVHVRPAWIAPGVALVPLFSWYKTSLFGDHAGTLSKHEEHFDCSCFWPPAIVGAEDPHNSRHSGVADFFLGLNELRFDAPSVPARDVLQSATVITFSHFLPRPELYQGYRSMEKVMGCRELDQHVRRYGANLHVFGHSHLPVDASIDGVRYVQYALGYPRDWGRCEEPPAIWNLQYTEDANERGTDIQAPLPSADTAPLRSSSANAHAAPVQRVLADASARLTASASSAAAVDNPCAEVLMQAQRARAARVAAGREQLMRQVVSGTAVGFRYTESELLLTDEEILRLTTK